MTEQDKAANAAVTIGSQLADYQLEERIGQGNLGVVFRARDQRLGRDVALKVLTTDTAADNSRRRPS